MFNIEDVQFIRITCDWWWQRLQNRPRIWDTNKCRYFKQALWIYPIFGKYESYEMCDNNDVKFKGTCLNNIPSCYWKLHNLRMKLWVKVSSKASQELDNNNELVCTSAPGRVFKQSCAIKHKTLQIWSLWECGKTLTLLRMYFECHFYLELEWD